MLMILSNVDRENNNLYNFMEISWHSLERSIQDIFNVQTMIYSKTEDTILFTARTFIS